VNFDWKRLRNDPAYRAELTKAVQTDDVLRDEGRLTFKTNLLGACWILGYTKIDPEIHKEALEFFLTRDLSIPYDQQGTGRLARGTLLYPRGTYKTTIDEVDTVQEITCFPLVARIFYVCANSQLADALVSNTAAHFVRPGSEPLTLFQALFPELCVTRRYWRKDEDERSFTAGERQQHPPIKEGHVMGFSCEAGVSGWHCERLKGDDLANNRNMKTESSRETIAKNYNINRKMLMPGGIEDKMGTRYHPQDPYGRELAILPPKSYRYVVKSALRLKDGSRLDPNGFPPRENVELPFELLGLTYDYLRTEYEADYDSFMTQLMNDDAGANEVIFPLELMNKATRPEEDMPLGGQKFISWRLPAKGGGFNTAAAAVGQIDGNRMYIVDAVVGVYRPSKLSVKIVNLAKKHNLHQVSIEETPGAKHHEAAIHNYALTMNWPLSIQWIPNLEPAERDTQIKALEPKMASTVRQFSSHFTNYGMTENDALTSSIARVCEALPSSIAMPDDEETGDPELQWEMMQQRDRHDRMYGMGQYAAREPVEVNPAELEDSDMVTPNQWGYDEEMPGLNG
jgi:hypothetical protein